MYTINLKKLNDTTFEVMVDGSISSVHTVSVQPEYAQKLVAGRVATDELIRCSFEFLLQRESNRSILRRFDLSVIAQYFPEYEQTMRNKLNPPS
jgi:hypothetical protein